MHIPEQLKPRHRQSEGLDYPSCIPAASLAVCVAVRAVFLPWIPDSSDDGSQGSEAGLRFIIKPKIRSLACRPSPIRSQIPLLSTVMLAFFYSLAADAWCFLPFFPPCLLAVHVAWNPNFPLCSACFFRSCAFHSFGGWRLLCLLGSFFKIKLGFQTLRSKWKLVVTTVACAGLPGQAKTLWLLLHLADCVSVRACYFLNPDLFFCLFVHTYWNHSAGSSIHTQWFSTLFHY